MRRFLAAQFAPLVRAWQTGFEADARRSAAAFLILVFLSYLFCLLVPEVRIGLSAYLANLFQRMELTDASWQLVPLSLFANNLRACLVSMVYGLVPFVRLPALALGVNAALMGAVMASYAAADASLFSYALELLPHGIFELPALVLSFAMGLYFCAQMTRRCRRDPTALPLVECLLLMVRLSVFFLLPLLAAAALAETYLTP